MPSSTLQVRDLAVSYGSARVLEKIDLEIRSGEIVGLVGPNGAGKTTTLRAISGLVERMRGEVLLDGELVRPLPEAVATAGVAHVPEGRGLIPSMTVQQNLRLAAVAIGHRMAQADLDYILTIFPAVGRLLDRRAGLLSGGEQQMVSIGRGLVVNPKFVMIDELSLGLAPKIVADLTRALQRVARDRGIGVFLVDQNVRGLSKVCDRIYVLTDGISSIANQADTDLMKTVYFGAAPTSQP